MTDNPIPYWMAFAHAKSFSNKRKMDFLIDVVHDKETIVTAMKKMKTGDKLGFAFTDKEWEGIQEAVTEIPNNSFLAEKLLDQGVEIVHVMEKYAYPKILKDNLKKDAPIVIYTKGNADLLNKNSIAIVGSRKCSKKSLDFADTIARNAVAGKSVIVSGFAKGIDKQALDSALNYEGQSIIVLPQGIETYNTKTYYAAIVRGDVLVISTYHPKLPWSVGLAMDRNKIIYGLAKEIYAAESSDSGGTWEGVLNGIKRERKVFIRQASNDEKNANNLLISKGAIPVDMEGKVLQTNDAPTEVEHKPEVIIEENNKSAQKNKEEVNAEKESVQEPDWKYDTRKTTSFTEDEIIFKTIAALKSSHRKGVTTNDVVELLEMDKNSREKINKILSSHPELIKSRKGRENCFHLKSQISQQTRMF
ncbi:MAG: DNA-processing protein DprA [Bacteroidetes bacterium]|nr:MAG: DNA-processing protein DprA [Bacteroidota bacterium]